MYKICVFAGTAEGRKLIERLQGRGIRIVACTATEYGGELLKGFEDVTIRIGRMNAEEMAYLFKVERFELVVDATHPYADLATENIRGACSETDTEYLRLQRESDSKSADGIWFADVQNCIEYLKNTQGNIFLTTGSKDLPLFCADEALRARLYVRVLPMPDSLRICAECGIARERIIAMQGPFGEELNVVMFRTANAKYVVTKDTGCAGGYIDKIHAAQKVSAQAVIIGRPQQTDGASLDELAIRLEERFGLMPPPQKVSLVGIGMGDRESRTVGMERVLRQADVLIGAKRMLESVDTKGKVCHEAILAEDIAQSIRKDIYGRRYAVLLSGDTGFYSGAKKLIDILDGFEVEVLPGIGSLSYFCAKLHRPWEDVRPISLHGRECDFIGEVRRNSAVFALLGGSGGAKGALERLCAANLGECTVHIGERLGYADEKITSGSARELIEGEFDSLSVMLIENPKSGEYVVTHGMEDDAFERDDVPMTKAEVRSISLSKLQLTQGAVAYDIGSGSGSVSVEMAMQATRGMVYAVEMKENAVALTQKNKEKFGLVNLRVIHGKAPDALVNLPAPTHAFIGGSSGGMKEIIACLLKKNSNVRIVVNAVTLETIAELSELSKGFDFCDIAEVSVSKPRTLGRYRLMTAHNPVYIFALQNGVNV
ncbi:MAG: precorrin-6A reductase [Christensenellales bacterium]|jgi:precorrin-6Y C5,15-methyltransferase (decarboxylating)